MSKHLTCSKSGRDYRRRTSAGPNGPSPVASTMASGKLHGQCRGGTIAVSWRRDDWPPPDPWSTSRGPERYVWILGNCRPRGRCGSQDSGRSRASQMDRCRLCWSPGLDTLHRRTLRTRQNACGRKTGPQSSPRTCNQQIPMKYFIVFLFFYYCLIDLESVRL